MKKFNKLLLTRNNNYLKKMKFKRLIIINIYQIKSNKNNKL